MLEKSKNKLLYIIYTLIVIFVILSLKWVGHFDNIKTFLNRIEQTSFDIRQKVILSYKKPLDSIRVIAIDDETYEYIMDRYGSWPVSRQLWSYVIDGIEKVNPDKLIFDLLFLKPSSDKKGDNAFINSVKNNKNVYLTMNFDYTSDDVRAPKKLDDKFKLKTSGDALKDNDYILFPNVRATMDSINEVTSKIGIINISRDDDGVIRYVTPVFKYQNDYYPNLSLLVAMDKLGSKEIKIKNNNLIIDEKHSIPLDNTNRAILNWYGKSQTYKQVSFWRVIKAINENDNEFLTNNFKDKIIYIGTTATSLSDVKTVPVESHMAGVELHATFLNNIFDNSFIKKVPINIDFVISIILAFIVGYVVLKTESVFKTFVFLFSIMFLYSISATYLMAGCNLWFSMVLPYFACGATFVFVYCEKYLLKSKDYEYTYKLAVTDGLTQLYNHRYFQEQMIVNLNNYKRYKTPFSLIMIDIDFFKKFNDTYGHQSGDAVLKQVASILKKNSRTSDIACRYGGEEMSVILTNTQKEAAIFMANKICQMVRETKFTLANNEKVNVTISVGVATMRDEINKPQELIEYCDKCLYKAKENGRNQVVCEF